MAYLIDVNVLIALIHGCHQHSIAARNWLETRYPDEVYICRVVQMGCLRLLTQPRMMKDEVLSASDFWVIWHRLMEDDRFVFIEEPEGFEAAWKQLTEVIPRGTTAGTDHYLAAFAQAGGWTFTTFDRGIQSIAGFPAEILT